MTAAPSMELVLADIGPLTVAFAAEQVAGIAPCPADVPWPAGQSGVLGQVQGMPVVDLVTYWRQNADLAVGERPRPPFLVVLTGGVLAIPVHRYRLATEPVAPAPAALWDRGIHALIADDDGFTLVLDMSRVVMMN